MSGSRLLVAPAGETDERGGFDPSGIREKKDSWHAGSQRPLPRPSPWLDMAESTPRAIGPLGIGAVVIAALLYTGAPKSPPAANGVTGEAEPQHPGAAGARDSPPPDSEDPPGAGRRP